jgi:hypothetical protein
MIDKVVAQLKTGTIKNVIPFGFQTPNAPYVCVKPESVPMGRAFRCIVHVKPDYVLDMENYLFNELSTLLKDWRTTDRHGNTVTVKDGDEYTDIVAVNDDSTISMERVFYVPAKLH